MNFASIQTENIENAHPAPKKHQFSVTEDLQIIQFVNRVTKQNINGCNPLPSKGSNQSIKWNIIALKLGRSAKQVRERWNGHLNPSINKGPWTREEDVLVAVKQREFGNKWAEIAKFFPGRTDTMVKNRWNTSVKARVPELLGTITVLKNEQPKCYQSYMSSGVNQFPSNSLIQNFSSFYDNGQSQSSYMPHSMTNNQIPRMNSVPSSPPTPNTNYSTHNPQPKVSISQKSFEEWLDQIRSRKFNSMSFLDLQEVPPLVQH